MKNEFKTNHYDKKSRPKIGLAILLVLIGSILLLFNLELIPIVYKPILISWQMLLIVLGISFLIKRNYANGAVLISIGVFFLLPIVGQNFPDILDGALNNTHNFWPVLLIIGGILFLFKRNDHSKCLRYWSSQKFISYEDKEFSGSTNEKENNYIDKSVMFSGSEQIVFSSNFRGGEINAAFGEIKLDLRKVSGLDKNNQLEVNAMFGSITIYIPAEWQINLKSSVLFGDIQDKRNITDNAINDDTFSINLKASCLFGSIEIKN